MKVQTINITSILAMGFLFIIGLPGLTVAKQTPDFQEFYKNKLAADYDQQKAFQIVKYLSRRWRLRGGGNKGYDESIDYVRSFLSREGFERAGRIKVLKGPLTLQPLAWEPIEASLSVVKPEKRLLHTYSQTPTFLAKYSGHTPESGLTAELIDVGEGTRAEDYRGHSVKGKVVLGRGRAKQIFEEAVEKRGALGVISDWLGSEEKYRNNPDMVAAATLPFREKKEMRARTSWGLKISPKSGIYLRNLLKGGEVQVQVKVITKFFESTLRELVAEIPGTLKPDERIVLVSHIDNAQPGANNNASGVGTHAELAAVLANMLTSGKIPHPARTITFLFGAEREGSRLWLKNHQKEIGKIVAVLNGDMTGEKTALTKGSYLMERYPDPAAFHSSWPEKYTPANDRHTGWPIHPLKIDPYPGHFLNDFFWRVVEFIAEESKWMVAQNPYEGGSDHDVFLPLMVPTVLSWHYPDYFMGTNFDTPDKVDPQEMKRVALVHGIVALDLASISQPEISEFLQYLEIKAAERLQQELKISKKLLSVIAKGRDSKKELSLADQLQKELAYLRLWSQWYQEAILSVEKMAVDGPSEKFKGEIRKTALRWQEQVGQYQEQLLRFAKGLRK